MGKSGYTSLSLEENEYGKLRKKWDHVISKNTELTFTKSVTEIINSGIDRVALLEKKFPTYSWVGKTENGCVIKDKNKIVEVRWTPKGDLVCSVDEGYCKHCIYAALNPIF